MDYVIACFIPYLNDLENLFMSDIIQFIEDVNNCDKEIFSRQRPAHQSTTRESSSFRTGQVLRYDTNGDLEEE